MRLGSLRRLRFGAGLVRPIALGVLLTILPIGSVTSLTSTLEEVKSSEICDRLNTSFRVFGYTFRINPAFIVNSHTLTFSPDRSTSEFANDKIYTPRCKPVSGRALKSGCAKTTYSLIVIDLISLMFISSPLFLPVVPVVKVFVTICATRFRLYIHASRLERFL